MNIYLIVGNNIALKNYPFESDSLKIGIDRGSFLALKEGIKLDYAVGDLDSCTDEEKKQISENVPNIIKLNPIKDDTDTKHAYEIWKDDGNENFIILGGIQGKRIEHFYANLELVMKDERVSIQDDFTQVFSISKEKIFHLSQYKYISFFPIDEQATISLEGFLYDAKEITIHKGEGLAISNEIKKITAKLDVIKGSVLVFLSKSDR